jgi:diguanylate cyclase (GGDEF)-like protein/PAS domain S-box-containing protein
MAVIALATFWSITDARRDAMQDAITQTSNLAKALDEHVARTIDSVDMLTRLVAEEIVTKHGDPGTVPEAQLYVLLQRHVGQMQQVAPQVKSLFVVAADGRMRASILRFPVPVIDLSDRDYFAHHRDDASPNLYFGQPVIGRVSGDPLFFITRRLSDRGGQFIGVVGIGMELAYFDRFYQSLALPESKSIVIVRDDGLVLYRFPDLVGAAGRDMSQTPLFTEHFKKGGGEGTYIHKSVLDDIERVISYRQVSGFPLVVTVSISTGDALAKWKTGSLQKSAFSGLIVLLLAAVGVMMRRQLLHLEHAERALAASEARFRDLAGLSSDWFWEQDADLRFTWVSEGLAAATGGPRDRMIGKHLWDIPVCNMTGEGWEAHRSLLGQRLPFRDLVLKIEREPGVFTWVSTSGKPVFDADEEFAGYHGNVRDVTAQQESSEKARDMAYHDPLTGLPNRLLLLDRLTQAIAKAQRMRQRVIVLFIDLDRFKQVNDTLGHDAGDDLLRKIAEHLGQSVRKSDTVARYGGDEFVVVLENVESDADFEILAAKILESATVTMRVGETGISVTPSVGVSVFPDHAATAEALLKAADTAMYQAKAAGRATYRVASVSSGPLTRQE